MSDDFTESDAYLDVAELLETAAGASVVGMQSEPNRLLDRLFGDPEFLVDEASVPYIVRDVINMNWWNTCGYLIGYENGRRKYLENATKEMKLCAAILKEFYRYRQLKLRDKEKLMGELERYLTGQKVPLLRQLKLHSMPFRRNDSQYYYKDQKPTWLDCTSRVTYAWKYVGQNGYMDFDGKARFKGGSDVIDFCLTSSVYPHKQEAAALFAEGHNRVKAEIFSQKRMQFSVEQWLERLGIEPLKSRIWLLDKIRKVRTDPYKNYEGALFKLGLLKGNNELLYGFKTSMTINPDTSHASRASDASRASSASHRSYASRASSASNASNASSASDAGATACKEQSNWFNEPSALGYIENLEHPPVFKKNKFAIAGHWKINGDLVKTSKLGWFDPFLGHGESPLFAKRHGINFVGIEINPDSMNGYLLPFVQSAANKYGDSGVNVELRLGDSANFYPDLVGKFDLCYTSPPYFDFEDYGFHNKVVQECGGYDEFHQRVTLPVFQNVYKYLVPWGVLALQTEKSVTLRRKWVDAIESIGFTLAQTGLTGQEENKYSSMAKRDQTLLIFEKPNMW